MANFADQSSPTLAVPFPGNLPGPCPLAHLLVLSGTRPCISLCGACGMALHLSEYSPCRLVVRLHCASPVPKFEPVQDAGIAIEERSPIWLSRRSQDTVFHGDRPRVQTIPILRRTGRMLATDSSTVPIPCAVCCRPKISYRETVSPNLYI